MALLRTRQYFCRKHNGGHKAGHACKKVCVYTFGHVSSKTCGMKHFSTVIFFTDQVLPCLSRHEHGGKPDTAVFDGTRSSLAILVRRGRVVTSSVNKSNNA